MLPPLVWGWAGGKIFAYEVLAEHADAEERASRQLSGRQVQAVLGRWHTGHIRPASLS